ncbi:unnamed protein product [Gongylonema pulchrum]|uniref:REM-1 domain-containing protein n=1 Tax=Gongylonema pulchrum TaxID=637853 RepID=A0A183E4N7_9BILA|nr:unnamed protein product [Gongylonema pulchrum]
MAAQAALSEYLTRVGRNHSRLSAEERELRKERRKSMPLQSSSVRQNSRSGGNGAINPNIQRYERAQLLKLRSAADKLNPKISAAIHELEIARGHRACELDKELK